MENGNISENVKIRLFDYLFVPTALHECEIWSLNSKLEKTEILEKEGL